MAIPGFQRMMLPILELCRADVPVGTAELSARIADHFNLTEEDRSVTIAPGRLRYKNRVSWAVGQLSGAGLLKKVADGEYRITASGKEVLASPPERLDLKFLARVPAWVEFRRTRSAKPDDEASFPSRVGRTRLNLRIPTPLVKKAKVHSALNPSIQLQDMVSQGLELYFAQLPADNDERAIAHDADGEQGVQTPNEILDRAHQTLRQSLAQDLLEKVKQASPVFFERLVVDLLLKMGYGGSRPDAGSVTRGGADGGIDGLIKEDKLGLDVIYIQAKRWSSTVGRPEIQAFAGSLEGNRAKKGVFMTTSQFSPDAKEYVAHIEKKIVLIDGAQLSEMMIDHDVGVSVGETYAVKRIDSDYFSEE
jgi:restriction system protein